MKLIRGGALFVGLLGIAGATQAGVSSTWTVTSDYDFRGISQTARDPALQVSVDYAHDSGFYAGIWGSNIDFGTTAASAFNPSLETDLYAGYKLSLESGLGFDFGGVHYTYTLDGGSDLNYTELYAGASYKMFSGKLFYSPKFGGEFAEDSLGTDDISAFYVSGDVSVPVGPVSLIAHAGYSFGDYWDVLEDQGFGSPYLDYAVGVGVTTGYFSWTLKYIDGSDLKEQVDGVPVGTDILKSKEKVVLSVATTFPWSKPE